MYATRAAVSGANTVEASPAANVRMVNARIRFGPYQRVRAANAGGYSTAPIATPASNQPATNHTRVGAVATWIKAVMDSSDPVVMMPRGPWGSSQRPIQPFFA